MNRKKCGPKSPVAKKKRINLIQCRESNQICLLPSPYCRHYTTELPTYVTSEGFCSLREEIRYTILLSYYHEPTSILTRDLATVLSASSFSFYSCSLSYMFLISQNGRWLAHMMLEPIQRGAKENKASMSLFYLTVAVED